MIPSERFHSSDPVTGETVWEGRYATGEELAVAIGVARGTLSVWSKLPLQERHSYCDAFAQLLRARKAEFAKLISRETGKPLWESASEVEAMAAKVSISLQAERARRQPVSREAAPGSRDFGVTSAIRYKPHGVMAVLGPYNFPGHLPNGHIVPALLAGNTVVFKPSEYTPGVGQKIADLWKEARLPTGVLQVVQGGADVARKLIDEDINGVLFTGSAATGKAISRQLVDRPGVLTALELGGNNPIVVHEPDDIDAAAYWTVQSAYVTAGQRCSCARRLIVVEGELSNRFIASLQAWLGRIRVGHFTADPEPFYGPVISTAAADRLLSAQARLVAAGGRPLTSMKPLNEARTLLTPGLIDMTEVANRPDDEIFGPLLQIVRVPDFEAAIEEANRTRFGLAASLFSEDRYAWEEFSNRVRAGVVNWNRPTNGASSELPFGGMGDSGNNRPSAAFAADYCSYPVATMTSAHLSMPLKMGAGFNAEELVR
jgi:succinylglutamic semialdehyde dehydrogenase